MMTRQWNCTFRFHPLKSIGRVNMTRGGFSVVQNLYRAVRLYEPYRVNPYSKGLYRPSATKTASVPVDFSLTGELHCFQ